MTVHIILNDSFPFGGAPTNRMLHYAKGLKGNGIECKIVIPFPHDQYNNIKNKSVKGFFEGVEFLYASHTTFRSRNFIKRRIDDFLGYVGTLIYLIRKTKRDDIVIGYHPTLKIYSYISVICKLCSLKLISELNELPYVYSEQTEEVRVKRSRFFNGIFKQFDGHIVISEALRDIAVQYSNAPVIKVPILIDTVITKSIKDDTPPVSVPYIFHSGSLTERKDGVCGMLEAFGIAKPNLPENVRFILTGNMEKSPDKARMKDIIEKYNLSDSVDFMGYLDTETLRRYQKYCSLVIINKYPTEQNKYCFATKTGEYLAFSRPIIITKVGEAMSYFEDNENAFIVEPNKPQLIAEKIVAIFQDSERANIVGHNGYKLAESAFEYRMQAKKMVDFFKGLLVKN